jgi:hypothetical protein
MERCGAVGAILLALVLVPAPLLPPHRLAEAAQSALGLEWPGAYLVAAFALHAVFYGALGFLASRAVIHAASRPVRVLQIVAVPLAVIGTALLIRSLKLGALPMLPNLVVPIAACLLGSASGLVIRYQAWKIAFPIALLLTGLALWGFRGGSSGDLSRSTEAQLRRLVAVAPSLPSGDARFSGLIEAAFGSKPVASGDDVRHNRAAILALGIMVGHERIARYVDIDPQGDLVRAAVALRPGTTLRGREDWPRHYALSAALGVLGGPYTSDAAGLLKEQLDALTQGSGFSFADLAADRAGMRLAATATRSDTEARALQARLRGGFRVDDFMPVLADLPENLTLEQFRSAYGRVGSASYRRMVSDIEQRIDQCAGLSALQAVAQ